MITGKYTHWKSLSGAIAVGPGVGCGDVDLVQAGQIGVGPIIERMPRYPQLQYNIVVIASGATTAGGLPNVEALMPDGTWQIVKAGTAFAANGAQYIQLFGPFIDLRVNLQGTITDGTYNAYIFKF